MRHLSALPTSQLTKKVILIPTSFWTSRAGEINPIQTDYASQKESMSGNTKSERAIMNSIGAILNKEFGERRKQQFCTNSGEQDAQSLCASLCVSYYHLLSKSSETCWCSHKRNKLKHPFKGAPKSHASKMRLSQSPIANF